MEDARVAESNYAKDPFDADVSVVFFELYFHFLFSLFDRRLQECEMKRLIVARS